ncbi:LysM peptidoglycan-binding domain-containing protein [Cellulomonas sp. URHD0024]|uniref:LysM peptidoglycan-binding domain-containing protein n=1 Tax=Cellulomonas sp. URHD0024 TaxID=1302620 RepID=UPI000403E516|nr:LysM peptidoglycan-binding domain-containing protein [Cellulomonas sp. URHD0024]
MSQSVAARSVGLRRVATSTGALALVAVAATATAGAAHADEQYTVRSGDTVGHIAARHGSSVGAIARANALADAGRIRIGQVLTIPSSVQAPAVAVTRAPAAASYRVVAGDNVSRIAARFGTTVQAIVAANGLDRRAMIRIGQTLTVPGAAAAPAPAAAAAPAAPTAVAKAAGSVTYTVRPGDTVSAVATKLGSSVAAIVAANHLDARAFIRIGQALTVPVAAAPAVVGNTFAGRTYSAPVVAAANANLSALRGAPVPSKAQMQAKIAATARSMGVDPALAQAVAFQESGFNHAVVSPANAIGAMQIIPSSGAWASELVGRPLNLLDPDDNAVAGVAILRSLVKSAPDLPTAIAGYYQGATSVKRNGMFADTRIYVANVQTHMTRFR